MSRRITITLDDEDYSELQTRADRRRLPMAAITRSILAKELESNERE